MSKPKRNWIEVAPAGSLQAACRHCGKPVIFHEGRQLIAHSRPTCDEFTRAANAAESYEAARNENIVRADAVLN